MVWAHRETVLLSSCNWIICKIWRQFPIVLSTYVQCFLPYNPDIILHQHATLSLMRLSGSLMFQNKQSLAICNSVCRTALHSFQRFSDAFYLVTWMRTFEWQLSCKGCLWWNISLGGICSIPFLKCMDKKKFSNPSEIAHWDLPVWQFL